MREKLADRKHFENKTVHGESTRWGVVKLSAARQFLPWNRAASEFLDRGHLVPDAERPLAKEPMVDGPQQMSSDTKQILDQSVERQESLSVPGRLEPLHLAFSSSCGLM